MGNDNVIIVDGANIAFIEQSQKGQPKVSNLVAVRRALEEKGFKPVIIVDASVVHQIDDPDQLEALLDKQLVRQAPSGTDADYFVLETAELHNAQVVSNDQYKRYRDRYPWIAERRVPVMIVNGEVELYEPHLDEDEEA